MVLGMISFNAHYPVNNILLLNSSNFFCVLTQNDWVNIS